MQHETVPTYRCTGCNHALEHHRADDVSARLSLRSKCAVKGCKCQEYIGMIWELTASERPMLVQVGK